MRIIFLNFNFNGNQANFYKRKYFYTRTLYSFKLIGKIITTSEKSDIIEDKVFAIKEEKVFANFSPTICLRARAMWQTEFHTSIRHARFSEILIGWNYKDEPLHRSLDCLTVVCVTVELCCSNVQTRYFFGCQSQRFANS